MDGPVDLAALRAFATFTASSPHKDDRFSADLMRAAADELALARAVIAAASEAARLLDEWDLIRQNSYAHRNLNAALAAWRGGSNG